MSLEEIKQTLEEERAAAQQERTATEQQVRAHNDKRQGWRVYFIPLALCCCFIDNTIERGAYYCQVTGKY